jgi:hypothetical protein
MYSYISIYIRFEVFAAVTMKNVVSSGMCVVLVGTDVSEELSGSIVRMTRVGELGSLAVTSSRRTLAPLEAGD